MEEGIIKLDLENEDKKGDFENSQKEHLMVHIMKNLY